MGCFGKQSRLFHIETKTEKLILRHDLYLSHRTATHLLQALFQLTPLNWDVILTEEVLRPLVGGAATLHSYHNCTTQCEEQLGEW